MNDTCLIEIAKETADAVAARMFVAARLVIVAALVIADHAVVLQGRVEEKLVSAALAV